MQWRLKTCDNISRKHQYNNAEELTEIISQRIANFRKPNAYTCHVSEVTQ